MAERKTLCNVVFETLDNNAQKTSCSEKNFLILIFLITGGLYSSLASWPFTLTHDMLLLFDIHHPTVSNSKDLSISKALSFIILSEIVLFAS